jgi:UDP-3-O-[3-hydroxymyristoyl] glucosamine N-acyltransferase
MILNAAQLCELLDGELVGDGDRKISGPSQIDKAKPGTVTFLANAKYEDYAYTTEASVLIVSRDFTPRYPLNPTLIKVRDVYGAMMFLVEKFNKNGVPAPGIADTGVIHPSATIGQDVSLGHFSVIEAEVSIGDRSIIYPGTYIGFGSKLGTDVTIYPGVKIYPNTQIGNRCIIHANAVIGCDGFGYRPDEKGHYHKINHVGSVVLEEDVEVGANAVIDRGTLAVTRIGKGTKIDNLVQVAHNVTIGEHTVIAAQAGIAGSSSVGNFARIGGQVGLAGHIHIPDLVEIQAQSGVHSGKISKGARLFGYPAINYSDYLKSYVVFKQLPALLKRLEELEKQVAARKNENQ